MMFVVFQQEAVDLAIIEVGIGGLSIIRMSDIHSSKCHYDDWLDHQDLPGSTLEEITAQKAGITLNLGNKWSSGPVTRECMDVIRSTASEQGATVQAFGETFSLVEDSYRYEGSRFPLEQLALKGAFQKGNATVAIRAFRLDGSHW